jgi:hypothetical protein
VNEKGICRHRGQPYFLGEKAKDNFAVRSLAMTTVQDWIDSHLKVCKFQKLIAHFMVEGPRKWIGQMLQGLIYAKGAILEANPKWTVVICHALSKREGCAGFTILVRTDGGEVTRFLKRVGEHAPLPAHAPMHVPAPASVEDPAPVIENTVISVVNAPQVPNKAADPIIPPVAQESAPVTADPTPVVVVHPLRALLWVFDRTEQQLNRMCDKIYSSGSHKLNTTWIGLCDFEHLSDLFRSVEYANETIHVVFKLRTDNYMKDKQVRCMLDIEYK